MDRRTFLTTMPAGLASLAVQPLTKKPSFFTTESIEVVHQTLTYSSLPEDLDSFRFAFLTDFHLGGWVQTTLIETAFKLVQAEGVSLMLHGGDYLWVPDTYGKGRAQFFINDTFSGRNDEELGESIYSSIASISKRYSFQLGAYGVLGNHDRWSNDHACYTYLPQGNITLLENSTTVLEVGRARIELYGTADYWTGVPKPPSFSKDKNSFKLLLTHNPDYSSYLYHKKNTAFHLSLSGHTHGGQIKLPVVGALTYNIQDRRYGEGLVDYGESKFYTSRGIGVVEVPFRVQCPPEVTIFTLRRGGTLSGVS